MAVPTTTITGPDRVEIDTLTDAAYALSIDADPGTASVAAGLQDASPISARHGRSVPPASAFRPTQHGRSGRPDCCSCLVARALGASSRRFYTRKGSSAHRPDARSLVPRLPTGR